MDLYDEEWRRKGATLSDKTARSEFGLTQDEIIAAIRAGKFQYRPSSMHGNPWLRLLRREVEDLVVAGFAVAAWQRDLSSVAAAEARLTSTTRSSPWPSR